jgi:hypothetical protein
MRRLLVGFLLALLLAAEASSSQELDAFRRIDELALNAPAEAESSLEDLARYLGTGARDDEELARAIYRWITANIDYDVVGFTGGCVGSGCRVRTPEEVLEERKGVCSDYAALFSSLSEISGLDAVAIIGRGKGSGYTVGSKIPESINHAWNAVRIDGEWKLVDATWGAGHLDPEEGFVERFEEFYFFTPPEELIWTHLPEDPAWQLLDPPISRDEFERLVYAKPAFFNNDMKILGPEGGTIASDDGATVSLSVPQDVRVAAHFFDGAERKLPARFAQVQWSNGGVVVRAAPPGPGEYTLRIYSRRVGQEEDHERDAYDWTLDYRIVAGPNSRTEKGLPVVWDAFWDMGLETASHPEGLIDSGSELKVTLSAPGDILLLARLLDGEGRALSEDRTLAQREVEGYTVRAAFPKPGEYALRIYAKEKGDLGGEYASAIEYAVLAESGSEAAGYPRTLGTFAEAGCRLIRPLEGRLPAGTPQRFELMVPGAETVAIINDGNRTIMAREGETFRGEVTLSAKDASVAARFPGDASYAALLVYSVEGR